jgi:hypothetical protein
MRVIQLTARPRPCLAPVACRRCPHRSAIRVRAASGDSEAEALPAGLTAQQVCLRSCVLLSSSPLACPSALSQITKLLDLVLKSHNGHWALIMPAVQAYEVLGLPNEGHTFDQVGLASEGRPWGFVSKVVTVLQPSRATTRSDPQLCACRQHLLPSSQLQGPLPTLLCVYHV